MRVGYQAATLLGGVDGLKVRLSTNLICLFTICLPLESEHSVVLKEIAVPLWQHSVCNTALQSQFGPKYNLPETAICAGAEGRDACDVRLLKKL